LATISADKQPAAASLLLPTQTNIAPFFALPGSKRRAQIGAEVLFGAQSL
jgi:hypothetical protein